MLALWRVSTAARMSHLQAQVGYEGAGSGGATQCKEKPQFIVERLGTLGLGLQTAREFIEQRLVQGVRDLTQVLQRQGPLVLGQP